MSKLSSDTFDFSIDASGQVKEGTTPQNLSRVKIINWVRLLHALCYAVDFNSFKHFGHFCKIMVLPCGQALQSLALFPGASFSDTKVPLGHRKQLSLTKASVSE